jgi:hypothetical protein
MKDKIAGLNINRSYLVLSTFIHPPSPYSTAGGTLQRRKIKYEGWQVRDFSIQAFPNQGNCY